mgnify:CR=1 FL=1
MLSLVGGCPPPVIPDDNGNENVNDNGSIDNGNGNVNGNANANDNTEPPPPDPARADSDGDGIVNTDDLCAGTSAGAEVDEDGCAVSQRDADCDGVFDNVDNCPDTPTESEVNSVGCPTTGDDSDGDGVANDSDLCPGTPDGATVNSDGCAPTQLDDDNDSVANDRDLCVNTATGADVDSDGCSSTQTDADGDGVDNEADQCPGTPAGATVTANGCPDADGDGVTDSRDTCAGTATGATVDATGCVVPPGPGGTTPPPPPPPVDPPPTSEVCGRGSGVCFEAHTTPGCSDAACCSSVCTTDEFCCTETWDTLCVQTAATVCAGGNTLGNDSCTTPLTINNGTTQFNSLGATTDGPNDGGICATVDIGADLWFTYRPTCEGVAIISLCGSDYDTTVAAYNGTGCPVTAAIGCSDDDCGFGLESRAVVHVTLDQPIIIRIGGFISPTTGNAASGTGQVTIICDVSDSNARVCGPGNGACATGHDTPGCDDANCCSTVCDRDPFCCDVRWDDFCARESTGLCGGSFDTCGADGTSACNVAVESAGCSDGDCCNAVCQLDPYCCLVRWDNTCVMRMAGATGCQ